MQHSSSNDSMKLGLTDSLCAAVQRKFTQARASGDLLFSDTELSILRSKQGVPFQLRYCPALAQKPKDIVPDPDKQSRSKPDPFANPIPALLIDEVPKVSVSHILVLNKYPVIHNHFILATKANKPQTDILEEADLSTSYACIKAWQGGSRGELFGFFNSGEHSGASQPHRHLQFLAVEDMTTKETANDGWRLLTDGMTAKAHPVLPLLYDPALPFIHFATRLEPAISSRMLYEKYTMLLKAAVSATSSSGSPSGSSQADISPSKSTFSFTYNNSATITTTNTKTTSLSYNLALTSTTLAILPRRSESASVPGAGTGPDSSVPINGTILAGTLMVKDQAEWDALRAEPGQALDDILRDIGFAARATVASDPDSGKGRIRL